MGAEVGVTAFLTPAGHIFGIISMTKVVLLSNLKVSFGINKFPWVTRSLAKLKYISSA